MDTTFKGKAIRIQDIDIPRIGYTIGVGEDELHAFMDIEANGSGFDKQGRVKMLFEPHKFFAKLSGDKLALAVKQGLAYKKWGTKPYPKDSYPRLIKAMAIDAKAALESCSWGLTQIMGEYHGDLGFDDVEDMVQAFMDSEAEHLEATVTLLVKWKIDDDLRAHRWTKVAEVWNGPGYKKNQYDTKMATAFKKWQGIRDTKWAPADAPVVPAKAPDIVLSKKQLNSVMQLGMKGEAVSTLQGNLKELGYAIPSDPDGTFGQDTDAAVRAFQKDAKLKKVDGWAGPETVAAIAAELKKREVAPKLEVAAKVVDANKGSPGLGGFSKTEVVTAVTAATGTASTVKAGLDSAKDTAASFMDLVATLGPWVLLALVIAGGAGFVIYERRNRRIEAQAAQKVL